MKFNFGRLLDNRRLLMILSLVTSVIIWLVIVYYVEPDKVQTIRNVPVTITADQVDALAALNLRIVDSEIETVDVRIEGRAPRRRAR